MEGMGEGMKTFNRRRRKNDSLRIQAMVEDHSSF